MTTRTKMALAILAISALPVLAGDDRDRNPPAERDCTPINGRNGYYGNPWCDGWDPDPTGHTLIFEFGPDRSVTTYRTYREPAHRRPRR